MVTTSQHIEINFLNRKQIIKTHKLNHGIKYKTYFEIGFIILLPYFHFGFFLLTSKLKFIQIQLINSPAIKHISVFFFSTTSPFTLFPVVFIHLSSCFPGFPGFFHPARQPAGGWRSVGQVTMRQAVEAQVLNPHCELGEQGQWGGRVLV